MITLRDLKVEIYADGGDRNAMAQAARNPLVKGFTTNPTLTRKAGVTDYAAFGRELCAAFPDHPISFEVIADTLPEMDRQARLIAGWGANVFVKLPVTTTAGESVVPLLAPLAGSGVQCNVTALFTLEQVRAVSAALGDAVPSFISVFAGRLADAGIDPVPIMREAVAIMRPRPGQRLIWASPREVLNVVQAHDVGCHVITMTHDLIARLPTLGRDPLQFSLETVRMFHDDARAAGFVL
jgi:transaldolase